MAISLPAQLIIKLFVSLLATVFSFFSLENMLKLSTLGIHIAPPVLGYYANIQTLEDMEKFLIGKWFDLLGIEHALFKRWEGA